MHSEKVLLSYLIATFVFRVSKYKNVSEKMVSLKINTCDPATKNLTEYISSCVGVISTMMKSAQLSTFYCNLIFPRIFISLLVMGVQILSYNLLTRNFLSKNTKFREKIILMDTF